MNQGPVGNRGFTLIETLVALLVVAIAYTGVAAAVSQFVDQRILLVERHTSHRIAWNRLMEQYLVARGAAPEESNFAEKNGVVSANGGQWRWQIDARQAEGQGLVRYQVDVFSAADSDRVSGSLTAFFTR